MTNVHIVILGLLCKEPMHGYEIKHVIQEHMNDWTDIKFGSIYFALSKLAESGDIEVMEEKRGGNRPEKRVYRITEKGKKNHLQLLKDLWTNGKHELYSLDIALFFIQSLPKEDVQKYLANRIFGLEKAIAYLKRHREDHEISIQSPPQARLIVSHAFMHTEAELTFLREVLSGLDELY